MVEESKVYVEVDLGILPFCENWPFPVGSICILWKLIKNKHLNSLCGQNHSPLHFCSCRDGEQIENEEDDEKYIFSDDSSELTIRKVDKNDEAEYVCIAENKAGEQDASIHLKVFGKHCGGQSHCSAAVPLTLHTQPIRKALSTLVGKYPKDNLFWPAPPSKP